MRGAFLALGVVMVWGFAASASVSVAEAQAREGFNQNRFKPAPTVEDGFNQQLPDTLGHLRFSAQLLVEYANDPLVVGVPGGDDVGTIVGDSVNLHAYGALGLWEDLEVWAGVPVAVYQDGDADSAGTLSTATTDGAGLGQVELGVNGRVLGEGQEGVQLGLSGAVGLPVGAEDSFASDGGVTFRGWATAAYYGSMIPIAQLGMAYRPSRDFENVDIGTELTYSLGVHVPVQQRLRLMAELNGATTLRDGIFSRVESPLEGLVGAKYAFPLGIHVGGGFTAGLSKAVGSPDYRLIAMVGFAPPRPEEAAPAPANAPAPPPPGDRDGDGILDDADACPDEPEDFDGFEDQDGCPEPDNDQDGFLDQDDACPLQPETYNDFEDGDGCPDEAPQVLIEEGEVVMPQPIMFAFDSDVILQESYATLRRVVQVMKDHPEIELLSIEGHTSDEGSPGYNQELSQRRAKAVVTWLNRNGVARERLQWRGFGLTQPLVPNDSEANRRINRRVEFVIEQSSENDGEVAP